MAKNARSAFEFSHQMNIDRYQRLLRTSLTEVEREFIKRRLGEEETLLEAAEKGERNVA